MSKRQKMISKKEIEALIDIMKDKRVARITVPDTIDIVMFEPLVEPKAFSLDANENSDDTKDMTEEERNMKLLLHSAG